MILGFCDVIKFVTIIIVKMWSYSMVCYCSTRKMKHYRAKVGALNSQLPNCTPRSREATNLTFNAFSVRDHEELLLYSDGPCKDGNLSRSSLHIQFLPCICPNGFKPDSKEKSRCKCECDKALLPYISTVIRFHRHKI